MANNTKKSTVTFLRDARGIGAIDAIAESMQRPRSYVINQALDDYVSFNKAQVKKIQRGLADAKAERFVSAKRWQDTLKGDYL